MAYLLNPLNTILVLLPALAANGAPVLLRYKGTPIDRGLVLRDGRPLLGPGKTWEGLIIGFLYGSTVALFLAALTCSPIIFYGGVLAALGALLGDMLGAFIKRRIGLERGAPAPVLDQLDFYSGALYMLYSAHLVLNPWVILGFAPVVMALHRATNTAAHKLRLKPVPW